MKKTRLTFILLALFGTVYTAGADENRFWIFFRDRGAIELDRTQALERAQVSLTARSLIRRSKSAQRIVDEADLPVNEHYIAAVREAGATVRVVSRYLNAVSVVASPTQLTEIRSLAFIANVKPFSQAKTRLDLRIRHAPALDDPVYGPSFHQNNMIGIPALHQRGLTGEGVMIGYLDTGFRLSHTVFDSLDVVAAHDFIHNDDNVAYDPAQDSLFQDSHGTAVLSTAVGYRDSMLIGPAFGAQVVLAKTEWTADETPVEEDYFVAGLEWMDSIGVDIASASLGYRDWYDPEDMDGQTAVTTLAVNAATRHGILCVIAAGNERQIEWGTIMAPADADSILAVGAVDSAGIVAAFSSPGPSADGRTKPDISALGIDVFCAGVTAADTFIRAGGTSLAAPLISGLAALIMEAHPDWSAQQVRTALKMTASMAGSPNNDYGWGIANGEDAADYIFSGVTPGRTHLQPASASLACYPNPFNGRAILTLDLTRTATGTLALYDLLGRQILIWDKKIWSTGSHTASISSSTLPSGVYLARFTSPSASPTLQIIVLK